MKADVLVSVAAYQDPDVLKTVQSLLHAPGRSLRIIVVEQSDWTAIPLSTDIEVIRLERRQARGPC